VPGNLASFPAPQLRRELGLAAAVAIVIGTTIGSGIFLVPHTMIQQLGSPLWLLAVWVGGGILSLFGALTYAELSAMYPEAGGEYVYLREAYGPFWAFTYGWTQTWVARSGAGATLATGFFLYLGTFLPAVNQVVVKIDWPIGPNWGPLEIRYGQLLAIVIILFLGLLNTLGVKLGGQVQVTVTVLKVVLISGVIVAGLLYRKGDAGHFSAQLPGVTVGFLPVFAALVGSLWAYDGWNTVVLVASEVKQPERNLPRALVLGTLGIISIYLAANGAYFLVLPPAEVAAQQTVAAAMMHAVAGETGAHLVSIAVMISIFAALNGLILGASRIPYAMAADGVFFAGAAEIHPRYRTPAKAIWLMAICSSVLVLSGRYAELFTCVIFASWILYAMAAASVVVLRRRRPEQARPYRVWGYPWIPGLFVVTAVVLLGSTAWQSPRESLLGMVLILIGIPFYLYWKNKGGRRAAK
jgi:amino acid transporter